MGLSLVARVCGALIALPLMGQLIFMQSLGKAAETTNASNRPNILFMIADDWGWPHAGAYGDPVVQTPTFDRLAREGVLFDDAYVSSPSCTPSRNAVLTGQYHWRLGEGANLWSSLDVDIPVFPLLLQEAGYHVGHWRKAWGPGNLQVGGYRKTHPAGKNYPKGFQQFLDARPEGKPFCFWLGSSDPHRSYKKGSGRASGIDVDKVPVPQFYPSVETIRSDIADYYFEVQRFDHDCAEAIQRLEHSGELDNTIIVMTGDHGMPFPRCKSNLYDMGVRVPMVIRWGAKVRWGRRLADFMSFVDLAPTFLEAAGATIPETMCGRSLLPVLLSEQEGRVDPKRDHVIFGKERHVPGQAAPSIAGYPCRGIRTERYLYLRNLAPDRWPAGVLQGATHPMDVHPDCDNGPTKSFLIEHRYDPALRRFYALSFAKRPAEELYDMRADADQLNNLAESPEHLAVKQELAGMLDTELKATNDPRIIGGGEKFDQYPYRARYKLRDGS